MSHLRALFPSTTVEEALLSPDGRWVSVVVVRGDRSELTLCDQQGRPRHRIRLQGELLSQGWTADSRLVSVTAEDGVTVARADRPVKPNHRREPGRSWRLGTDLTRAHIIDSDLPRGPGPVLWLERASQPGQMELLRLHADGPVSIVTQPSCDRVVLDVDGAPWLGLTWLPSGSAVYRRLDGGSGSLGTEVLRLEVPESLLTHPDRQTATGLAVSAYFGADDHLAWGEIDLTSGGRHRLVGDPGRDVEEVVTDFSGVPLAARSAGRFDTWWACRPGYGGEPARLQALLGPWTLLGRSMDDQTWLVRSEGPTRSPRHHLWLGQPRRLVSLPAFGRSARARGLTSVEVEFGTRDGQRVQGRLTTARRRRGKTSLVVLAHGGPWARTDWSWDPTRLWLAGAGHAVLEPDFRGSDGRGRRWLELADRDWGGAMQDDLVDARNWAVKVGVAEESRCHVMGHSYGGYAALRAVTDGSEVFRSAIALAPATDLVAMTNEVIARGGFLSAVFRHRVGDPAVDHSSLEERSPLTWASRASGPILLAHGDCDPVFDVQHTLTMSAALSAAGAPHELRIYRGEGHGLSRRNNQIDFARRVLDFLEGVQTLSRTAHSRP